MKFENQRTCVLPMNFPRKKGRKIVSSFLFRCVKAFGRLKRLNCSIRVFLVEEKKAKMRVSIHRCATREKNLSSFKDRSCFVPPLTNILSQFSHLIAFLLVLIIEWNFSRVASFSLSVSRVSHLCIHKAVDCKMCAKLRAIKGRLNGLNLCRFWLENECGKP